jgi:hypothetical protein
MTDPAAEGGLMGRPDESSYFSLFVTPDNREVVPIRWEPQPGIIDPARLLGQGVLTENYDAGDEENPGDFYRVIRLSEEEFYREGPTEFQEHFRRRTDDLIEEALAVHKLNPDGEIAGMARLLEVGLAQDERVFTDPEGRDYVFKDCRVYFRYRGIPGGRALSAPEAKALTLREKIEILIQAAAALAEIHAKSWIHGDIKPENILWARDADGRLGAMVIDFNSVRAGSQLTSDSPLYSATRDCVIVGGRRIVHPRIDIASFGRTMVEFLLGLTFLPHEEEETYVEDELFRNLDYWLNRAGAEELAAELVHRGYAVAAPFIRYAKSMTDADIGRRPAAMADVAKRLASMARRVGRKLDQTVFLANFLCGDAEALIARAIARGHVREPEVSAESRDAFARFLRHHMSGERITVYEFAGLGRGVVREIAACERGVAMIDIRMGLSTYRTGELDDMAIEALFHPESPARLRYLARRRSRVPLHEGLRSLFIGFGDYFRQIAFGWHRLWRSGVAGSARMPIKATRVRRAGS